MISDNPKWSYAPLTFGVLKSHLGFKFHSKTLKVPVPLKYINDYDFAEISKSGEKNDPTGIFSHISILGLAQKHMILIEWIIYFFLFGLSLLVYSQPLININKFLTWLLLYHYIWIHFITKECLRHQWLIHISCFCKMILRYIQ